MTHYLIIFILPFLMVNLLKSSKSLENLFFLLFVIYLIIIVGFRFEMGLDWSNYLKEFYDRNFNYAHNENFKSYFNNLLSGNIIAIRNIEPLYLFTLKISNLAFGNIILFNFLNALIAIGCLSFFCFKLENKWLGLAISVSFIIFYGMDIIRQFSALGLIFLTIYNLSKKNYYYSLIYWFLSLGFHFSSIIFIFLFLYIIFTKIKFRLILFLISSLLIIFSFFILGLDDLLQTFESNSYINSQDFFQSSGTIYRLILCVIPLIIFFSFKKFFYKSSYFQILNWYSIVLFILIFLYMFKINQTIIDRFIVYSLPFQIIVYSYVIKIFDDKKIKNFYLLFVTSIYLILSFGWLYFSEDNLRVYIPYKSVIWENYDVAPSVICNKPKFICQLEGQGSNVQYE